MLYYGARTRVTWKIDTNFSVKPTACIPLIPYSSGHNVVLKHIYTYIFRSTNSCNITCQKKERGKFIGVFGITPK